MTDCNCELCQISHVIQWLKPRCTLEEWMALEKRWDWMAYAEMELWSGDAREAREKERGAG